MSSTGLVLATTQDIVNYHGLVTTGWHFANRDGRLHLAAALYRAVTGTTPDSFYTRPQMALLLIESNETVMEAIRWISAVLPTEPPTDMDTGADDHLEHLDRWLGEEDFFTGRRPNVSDVIGVLIRAEQTADTLTDVPAPRLAA